MTVDERRRIELFERLTATLGPEAAATMSELITPAGRAAASQDSVDLLAADTTTRFDEVGRRFDEVDQRFEQVDQRFERVEGRLDRVERRLDGIDRRLDVMDQRFDTFDAKLDALRYELLAAFRGELVTAVSGQTRAVIVATATATFGIGGLAVTLAQLL